MYREGACSMLRQARRKVDATMAAVSQQTGIPMNTLAQVERRTLVAPARHRRALSEFFGQPESDFFDPETGLARRA